MKCSRCGAEAADSALYCASCGWSFHPRVQKIAAILSGPIIKKGLVVVAAVVGLFVIAIADGIGKLGGKAVSEYLSGTSSADIAKIASREVNKKMPMMIDAETRIDSTSAGPGGHVTYNYTLINYSAADLNALTLSRLEDKVTRVTCEQKTENLLAKKISLQFRYRSSDGLLVKDFTIYPRTCS